MTEPRVIEDIQSDKKSDSGTEDKKDDITDHAAALAWLSTLPEAAKPLARRLLCQCGAVAFMSKEEKAEAMRDELARIALMPVIPSLNLKADIDSKMKAIDKWLDREEGKPVQAVDTRSVNVNVSRPASEGDSEILKRFYLDYHA